tara:strand:+ start:1906 stop:2703 length:798 start_codon:yes stop_codon:yes gene_type:complete
MTENKNAPVKKQENSVMPSYLQDMNTDKYSTGMGSEDIVIPRLKICQPMSSTAKEENAELRDGQLYSSIDSSSFGDEMDVILVDWYKAKTWFSEDNKFLANQNFFRSGASDIFGPEAEMINSNEALKAKGQDQFCYWAIRVDDLVEAAKNGTVPDFYLWSVAGIAMKNARKFNSQIKINEGKKLPIFCNIVTVNVIGETTKKGKAYIPNFTIKQGVFPTDIEFKILVGVREQIDKMQANTSFNPDDLGGGGSAPTTDTTEKAAFN